jgi:hypothetical protein
MMLGPTNFMVKVTKFQQKIRTIGPQNYHAHGLFIYTTKHAYMDMANYHQL